MAWTRDYKLSGKDRIGNIEDGVEIANGGYMSAFNVVTQYGATRGDTGTIPAADSAAAINQAITDASALGSANGGGGGGVFIPPGTYRLNAPLVFKSNVTIFGLGSGITQLYQTSAAGANPLATGGGTSSALVNFLAHGFLITGNGNQASNTGGILLTKADHPLLEDVVVSFVNNYGFQIAGGATAGDAQGAVLAKCGVKSLLSVGASAYLLQAAATAGGAAPDRTRIDKCFVNQSPAIASVAFKTDKGSITRGYGADATISGCEIQGCTTAYDVDGNAVVFTDNHFEVASGAMTGTVEATGHYCAFKGNRYAAAGGFTFTDNNTGSNRALRLGEEIIGTLTTTAIQLVDPLALALGLQTWGGYPSRLTQSALTSQTIYAMAVSLCAGQVVSSVVLWNQVAASGTSPTGFFVGLADSTGKMLVQSSNLNASTELTAVKDSQLALASSYTVPATGIYYVVILQNGTWGTTNAQLGNHGGSAGVTPNGTAFLYATGGTGQTALPANGSSLTLSATGAIDFARALK